MLWAPNAVHVGKLVRRPTVSNHSAEQQITTGLPVVTENDTVGGGAGDAVAAAGTAGRGGVTGAAAAAAGTAAAGTSPQWAPVAELLQQLGRQFPHRSCNALREMEMVLGIGGGSDPT